MSSINQLKNLGIEYVGDVKALKSSNKTFIIVGVARSGTSMIAGSLDKLGVFMGDLARDPVYEDVKLAKAIEENNWDYAESIIETYDRQYDIWGYKRPSAINNLSEIKRRVNNPIFLIVFRDILSIANRNKISMGMDLTSSVISAYREYNKIINFISNNSFNGFLFSYEKIMQDKESFIDCIIDAIGKEKLNPDSRIRALEFIQINSENYLNATRVNRGIGFVDKVSTTEIRGWAKYINDERTATVELYNNGVKISSTRADKMRPDVKRKNIHSTGECGFRFDLTELEISPSDELNLKLSEEVMFLRKEPFHINT